MQSAALELRDDMDPAEIQGYLAVERGRLAQREAQAARRLPTSYEELTQRRMTSAAHLAAELALLALTDPERLRARARGNGATSGGMQRLGQLLAPGLVAGARAVFQAFADSCERCLDTGWVDGRNRRCRCVRGQAWLSYRCPECEDSGWRKRDDARCSCRDRAKPRSATRLLLQEGLISDLPRASRGPARRFASDPEQLLSDGAGLWIEGGQKLPAGSLPRQAYLGLGAARYLSEVARRKGARTSELSALDLIARCEERDWLLDPHELVVVRTPERALPTARLRRAIEQLLSDAWDQCAVVVISTALTLSNAPPRRSSWSRFLARAGEAEAWLDFSEIAAAIGDDPAIPFLGEVHPAMLSPLSATDYLTPRACSLLARLTPAEALALQAA